MRILVVGAGALGGFFGAHLARTGRDVTFLVRPTRQRQLARNSLQVVSAAGDFSVHVDAITAGDIRDLSEVILLCVKSYSLNEAIDQFAPAVGEGTMIVPILNGMAHIDSLTARFGTRPVLGGMAQMGGALDQDGRIVHVRGDELVYGEMAGGLSERVIALSGLFAGAGFTGRASESIAQDMWEKWVQMGTGAGMTCLMRGSVGEILAVPGGREAILALFGECCAVATAAGYPPRPEFIEYDTDFFTTAGSPTKASTLRDIERGSMTEGDHILGQLTMRARALGVATPILDLAYIHLLTYEGLRRATTSA
jgi:2-dehydropantoate 2-reductase